MILHSFYLLTLTLCALTLTQAGWFKQPKASLFHFNFIRSPGNHKEQALSSIPSQSYSFSLPPPTVIIPIPASQGMLVTSILPLYEICPTPDPTASTAGNCTTAFTTLITSSCSTVLTYAFRNITVSDCNQNIIFSTSHSYDLATATAPVPRRAGTKDEIPSMTTTTYVQSITSYYQAPWQSLASDTLGNITLRICRDEFDGKRNCSEVQQVWIVRTEEVLVTSTSALSVSTSFASPVVGVPFF